MRSRRRGALSWIYRITFKHGDGPARNGRFSRPHEVPRLDDGPEHSAQDTADWSSLADDQVMAGPDGATG